jgi:hypothetical protein
MEILMSSLLRDTQTAIQEALVRDQEWDRESSQPIPPTRLTLLTCTPTNSHGELYFWDEGTSSLCPRNCLFVRRDIFENGDDQLIN